MQEFIQHKRFGPLSTLLLILLAYAGTKYSLMVILDGVGSSGYNGESILLIVIPTVVAWITYIIAFSLRHHNAAAFTFLAMSFVINISLLITTYGYTMDKIIYPNLFLFSFQILLFIFFSTIANNQNNI